MRKIRKLDNETMLTIKGGQIQLLTTKEFSTYVKLHKFKKLSCSYVKETNNMVIRQKLQLMTSFDTSQIMFNCEKCDRIFLASNKFDNHMCKDEQKITCIGKYQQLDKAAVRLIRITHTQIEAIKKFLLDKF